MTQRREEEAYDSVGSMSDAADDRHEVQYTSQYTNIGKPGLCS